MSPKKIMIIVGRLTGGGAERVASLWINGFVDRGYEVAICLGCRKSVPITYPVPKNVVVFQVWNFISIMFSRYFHIELFRVRRLRKVIKEYRPDVIIGVMRPWAECARRASFGMGIKIINTEHNSFERPVNKPMSREDQISKFVWNKYYEHVTVLTEADKRCLSEEWNHVSVLHNPLAMPLIKELPQKEKIVLAVGRLNAWYYKGFDLLIKAWGEVVKVHPDWKLIIVGGGSPKAVRYMRQLIADECCENKVELAGFQENILPLYKLSSIFVLSSRYEGFGMALIEAMSQGCAIVACDYKGRQREILGSDKNGIICPVEDVKSLISSIKLLIENDKKRITMQNSAIQRSKAFQLTHIMDRWEKIFKEI